MKNVMLLLFCCIMIGCGPKEYIDNQEVINYIDSLYFSETVMEFNTDSTGGILDTISIERKKIDDKKRVRFSKTIYFPNQTKIKKYLTYDEDVFYQ